MAVVSPLGARNTSGSVFIIRELISGKHRSLHVPGGSGRLTPPTDGICPSSEEVVRGAPPAGTAGGCVLHVGTLWHGALRARTPTPGVSSVIANTCAGIGDKGFLLRADTSSYLSALKKNGNRGVHHTSLPRACRGGREIRRESFMPFIQVAQAVRMFSIRFLVITHPLCRTLRDLVQLGVVRRARTTLGTHDFR